MEYKSDYSYNLPLLPLSISEMHLMYTDKIGCSEAQQSYQSFNDISGVKEVLAANETNVAAQQHDQST